MPDPHIRMNLISTISNEGSVHFMTYKETMTAALFITFLERLLGETTRKVFLIVDRLKAHEAKKVEAWTADHRDRIELFFLPRYAPERNPDEYLNNDLKGGINATSLCLGWASPPLGRPTLGFGYFSGVFLDPVLGFPG